ncbi:Acetyltransferase (GNAT) domain-containing protein [Seinonella peptonophila]|uniref:Acetyltransferase (GNAT) domain-containing protein n=1 Tax=Seinonella peptonophila TaxID=112248 RepID=A0A1M5BG72_9BACL|nr:GNAT family N-acetyltransferase [Seinonella peptonophila]SHF41400.1 Acetyltransferase (GNAT) domain-containing protein [Seinonella peptonophila]
MISNQQLVINNFADKLKIFTNAVQGNFNQEEDFVLANTGIPTDTFNVLLPMSAYINNLTKIKKGIEDFSSKKYPFSTWIDARYLNDSWQNLMREFNLEEAERNVMMKLENTVNVDQIKSQQLIITRVDTLEELMEYKDVLISLFEGTPEKDALQCFFKKISEVNLGSEIQMFIGRINEETVSTGLLIESKDSYGIYDVMTKEILRGKGYGSEMFQYILSQTKDKQKPVVLQASEDGKNIYKRFGFVDVGEMVVYE